MNSMSNKSDHSPSTSPVNVPFNGQRRSSIYDEMPYMPGSSGSTTEAFTHQPHPELNGIKQSPSPTTSTTATFAAYPPAPPEQQHSQAHDHRAQYAHHTFYSHLPPNLDMPNNSQSTTLPRLDPPMSYPSRLSPSIHAPSPAPHSHMTPHPYDRERREKGYDPIVLPSTPLAADARSQGKY